MSQKKYVMYYHQEKAQSLNPNLQNAKSEDNTDADNIKEKHNNNTNVTQDITPRYHNL
jgi:hypothetical protein